MGSLNIYLNNAQGKKLMFSKVGDQGTSWKTVHLDLDSISDYHVGKTNVIYTGMKTL